MEVIAWRVSCSCTIYCVVCNAVGYTMDVMYFNWLPQPVEIDKEIQLPQFNLKDKILFDCSQNYTGGLFTDVLDSSRSDFIHIFF